MMRQFQSARVAGMTAVALLAAACTGGADRRSARVDSAVVAPAPTSSRAAAAAEGDYVGLHYVALPANVRSEGGAVIPRENGDTAGDYDLARVRTPLGDMIWLDTLSAPAGRMRPSRVVLAVLRIPPLAADERLFMASCDVAGRVDERIVAIAVTEPGAARSTRIRQAWRADTRRARFDIIPIAGIACEEPGS